MTDPADKPTSHRDGGQELYDQRFARVLIARPLARTPVTPNQLTVAIFDIELMAIGMFVTGDRALAHWAAGIFVFARFADHADGELARLTGKTSKLGFYLDFVTGALSYALLFLGLGIGAMQGGWHGFGLSGAGLDMWVVAIGGSTCLAVLINTTLQYIDEQRQGIEEMAYAKAGGFAVEDAIYLMAPIIWIFGPMVFLILGAIGTHIHLAVIAVSFFRRYASSPS